VAVIVFIANLMTFVIVTDAKKSGARLWVADVWSVSAQIPPPIALPTTPAPSLAYL